MAAPLRIAQRFLPLRSATEGRPYRHRAVELFNDPC